MLKKIFNYKFFILLILFANTALANPETHQLKVGVIIPLTGEFAYIGEEIRKGFEIKISQLSNVEVVFEDDMSFNKRAAVTAYTKLTQKDQADIVFVLAVTNLPPLVGVVKRYQVPVVAIWDHNQMIYDLGDLFYSVGFSNELAGKDLAKFTYNQLSQQEVAIVSAHDEWSEIITENYIDQFKKLGGNVKNHFKVALTEDDFATYALKIIQSGTPAVFAPLYSTSLTAFFKKLKQLNFQGKIITGEGLFDADIKTLGTHSVGIYTQRVIVKNNDLLEEYKDKFGEIASISSLGFVAMGYDSATAAGKIANNSGSLLERINQVKFTGITGIIDLDRKSSYRKPMSMGVVTSDLEVKELPEK